jgi:uncharacterized membrane protein
MLQVMLRPVALCYVIAHSLVDITLLLALWEGGDTLMPQVMLCYVEFCCVMLYYATSPLTWRCEKGGTP